MVLRSLCYCSYTYSCNYEGGADSNYEGGAGGNRTTIFPEGCSSIELQHQSHVNNDHGAAHSKAKAQPTARKNSNMITMAAQQHGSSGITQEVTAA